jgi:hypothetical protein
VLEMGKHGQRHDDASKKVTASAGVAVISFMQGFRPSPAVDPSVHQICAEKSRLWHTDQERRAIAVEVGARSAAHRLTTTEWGLDGEDPARRCLADRWHHRGTQPSAPTGSTAQACSHDNRTGAPGYSCRDALTAGSRASTGDAEPAPEPWPARPFRAQIEPGRQAPPQPPMPTTTRCSPHAPSAPPPRASIAPPSIDRPTSESHQARAAAPRERGRDVE